MNRFTFRVDANEHFKREDVVKFFEKYEDFERYLIYHEISEVEKKPHYQGVVYTTVAENTLRQRITRYFKCEKGSYSMATVKKDEYEIYITKDGDQVCVKGYTPEEVIALHDQAYHKKKRPVTFSEQLDTAFLEWMDTYHKVPDALDTGDVIESVTRFECMEWILEFLTQHGKWQLCNKRQIASLFTYLRLKFPDKFKHGDRSFKNTFINACLEEVF